MELMDWVVLGFASAFFGGLIYIAYQIKPTDEEMKNSQDEKAISSKTKQDEYS